MKTVDILLQFQRYLDEEIQSRKQKLPYACCLSTTGLDDFPNARFVSLKEIRNDKFIISGTLSSRKGEEIKANNKVSLSFWWPETQRQVRVQGVAHLLGNEIADQYFNGRSLESRIVSVVSEQGLILSDVEELIQKYDTIIQNLDSNQHIERPKNWGAYAITPVRIEFLTFRDNRFHDRTLFQNMDKEWKKVKLQP